MADFVNEQELYDYVQKEKAWEQSRTRPPRYERGLPDICYDMLDKLNKLNEFYAKQLAYTVPKVYIATDLQPKCSCKMDEVKNERKRSLD